MILGEFCAYKMSNVFVYAWHMSESFRVIRPCPCRPFILSNMYTLYSLSICQKQLYNGQNVEINIMIKARKAMQRADCNHQNIIIMLINTWKPTKNVE